MTSANFMDRMKKESQKIQDKEDRLAIVKKHYSRFGTKIVTIMMSYLSTENGMARLFKLLNMPRGIMMPSGDQHNMVVNWMTANGERRFLELHEPSDKKKPPSYTVKPIITEDLKKPLYSPNLPPQAKPDAKQVLQASKAAQGSPAFQPSPLIQPIPVSPPSSSPQKSHGAQASAAPQASPFPPSSPVSPHASSPKDAPPSVKSPASPDKPTPGQKTWPAVERRSGKERRKMNNRRGQVETIFKNKRFGGERRSGKDRRKPWKPAP